MEEKTKYKERYTALQQTYEARLQSIGGRFEAALQEIYADESLALLQQDTISRDFIGQRIHELVAHALTDEKEHFIRALSEKLAKKDASLKAVLKEREVVDGQKKAVLDDLRRVAAHVDALQMQMNATASESHAADVEIQRLQRENQGLIEDLAGRDEDAAAWTAEKRAFLEMQQELIRLQAMYSKDQAHFAQNSAAQTTTIADLTAKVEMVELTRAKATTEVTQLSLSLQEKSIALAHAKETIESLRASVRRWEPLDGQLADQAAAHQATLHQLEKERWELQRKYDAVGEQVEALIRDHDEEKTAMEAKLNRQGEDAARALASARETAAAERDAAREKMAVLEETARERDVAWKEALRRVDEMEAKAAASDLAKHEIKVQLTKRVVELEAEVAAAAKKGLEGVELERCAREDVAEQFGAFKRMAELKMQSLTTALQAQKDAAKREMEAEKRVQWQEEASKKHAALVEQMQRKYETAMAALQREAAAARSKAAEVATAYEKKTTQFEWSRLQHEQHQQAELELRRVESKVAESAKHVPGNFVPRTQHKAELDKVEAKLTLRLQTQHQHEKVQWEEKLQRMLEDKAAALQKEIDAWKAAAADEKEQGDECKAALLLERKQNVECRAILEEAMTAKTLLVQRLEEANVNLGRLKALVGDQHKAIKQWETKFTQLQAKHEELRHRLPTLEVEVAEHKEETRMAKEDHLAAMNTIQQLRQDLMNRQSVQCEREAAAQAVLKEKMETMAYLQQMLSDAQTKEAAVMTQLKEEGAIQIKTLEVQISNWETKHNQLHAEVQAKDAEHTRAMDAIDLLEANVARLEGELEASEAEVRELKAKKQQYKQALAAQKENLTASQYAQETWKHEMVVHETTRLQQWIGHVEVLQSQLHSLKVDFKTAQQTVRRLLQQDRHQYTDVCQQIGRKAQKLMEQMHAMYTKQLMDLKLKEEQVTRDQLAKAKEENAIALTALSKSLEADWLERLQMQKEDAKRNEDSLRQLIQEKETKIDKLNSEIRKLSTEGQTLQQQLEFSRHGGAKEIEFLKLQLVERDGSLHDKNSQIQTIERTLSAFQTDLQTETQRTAAACEALTRLSHGVLKQSSTALVDLNESLPVFRKSIQMWSDQMAQSIQLNQEQAIAGAVQPFKEELLRAPQVLGRKDSEFSKSVLAMAAPMADELATGKETIGRLTAECQQLKTELDKINSRSSELERTCEALGQEKEHLQAYLELAQTELKSVRSAFSTQMHEAVVQSEDAVEQLKEAWTKEAERLKHEHEQAIHEMEQEVDDAMRQNTKLRVAMADQEAKLKDEVKELVRRNHALARQQRVDETRRPATDRSRLRTQEASRQANSSRQSNSMRELSILMEESLKASQQDFQAKMLLRE
ncbi:Aste57867_12744 [Aphanomyces stellatus]|uniref:Aste57867_12744 protein n=1 Tax=Aphanomyces stellatus TaxID=120398 RepID=A0A485KWD3_9STRA|nr:hypothetical protein As57867_012696 [Aphanomyces stellatus]VFT89594.1 Aste57867_12744 [Aphanomyces stellatus]